MADTPVSSQNNRHFDFKQLFAFFLHPRQVFTRIAAEGKPVWLMPMLALNVSFLLSTIVSGTLRARAAAQGVTSLPADWQWWTTDMQNSYMQAIQATQGPVFVYVIPIVLGLARLWLVWALVSALLHLMSTLVGGRGKMGSALNVVAWASLPFVLRDLLRVIYMLIAGHAIASPGLSGLTSVLFLSKLLANVDIFLVWHAVLLVICLAIADILSNKKAALAALIVLAALLLAQAGLGALSARLGGLAVSRPF